MWSHSKIFKRVGVRSDFFYQTAKNFGLESAQISVESSRSQMFEIDV